MNSVFIIYLLPLVFVAWCGFRRYFPFSSTIKSVASWFATGRSILRIWRVGARLGHRLTGLQFKMGEVHASWGEARQVNRRVASYGKPELVLTDTISDLNGGSYFFLSHIGTFSSSVQAFFAYLAERWKNILKLLTNFRTKERKGLQLKE